MISKYTGRDCPLPSADREKARKGAVTFANASHLSPTPLIIDLDQAAAGARLVLMVLTPMREPVFLTIKN
jgi:hypothetical protein